MVLLYKNMTYHYINNIKYAMLFTYHDINTNKPLLKIL